MGRPHWDDFRKSPVVISHVQKTIDNLDIVSFFPKEKVSGQNICQI